MRRPVESVIYGGLVKEILKRLRDTNVRKAGRIPYRHIYKALCPPLGLTKEECEMILEAMNSSGLIFMDAKWGVKLTQHGCEKLEV